MGYLKAQDAISGQEGMAFMKQNGENKAMWDVKSIEATLELNKAEFKALGKRVTQHKVTGVSGSGSMTAYVGNAVYAQMGEDYIKRGIITPVDIRVINEDPASEIGRQSVILHNVVLDSIPVAKLDVDADFLEQDLDFTFDDITLLETFKMPNLG